MAENEIPTPTELRKLLRYDPESGKLYWLERPNGPRKFNARFAGKEAFTTINGAGYHHGTIYGRFFLAHRVAWAIYHGEWPAEVMDHINRNRADNRLKNLRAVSQSENRRNSGMSSDNTSGVKGVSWNRARQCWVAYIGKAHLGGFKNKRDAIYARQSAERAHGYAY